MEEYPQVLGLKDAREYLADNNKSTKEAFMEEGRRISKKYGDKGEQEWYLHGWQGAWTTDEKPAYPKGYGRANFPPSLEEELDERLKMNSNLPMRRHGVRARNDRQKENARKLQRTGDFLRAFSLDYDDMLRFSGYDEDREKVRQFLESEGSQEDLANLLEAMEQSNK